MRKLVLFPFVFLLASCDSEKTVMPLTHNITELQFLVRHYYQVESDLDEEPLEGLARHINSKIAYTAALSGVDNYIAPFATNGFCRLVMNSDRIPLSEGNSREDLVWFLNVISLNSIESIRLDGEGACRELIPILEELAE